MRITSVNRLGEVCEAYKKSSRHGLASGYRCQPSGKGHNLTSTAKVFDEIEEAAGFLKANPNWGIWMRSPSRSTGLFYDNILIDGAPR